MSQLYEDPHRELHDRFDTRRLADRLEEKLLHDTLAPDEQKFIEARDMFFLVAMDARGHVNCSYRGSEPGFVRAKAREIFANCPRYVHKMALIARFCSRPMRTCPHELNCQ